MNFAQFERLAQAYFDEIPEELRAGVEYLSVERRAVPHPSLPEVFTLGECATGELELGDELLPSRSGIHLYWGSFRALAELDPDFDWEGELWETLVHELRHHRESGAGEDALEDFDVAAEHNFRRREGEPFDPLFFRLGEPAGDDAWEVDGDLFAQRVLTEADFRALFHLEVEVAGRRLRVERPAALGDVHFLFLEGVRPGADGLDTALVLVRRRGAWESLLDLLRRREPRVLTSAGGWTPAP